jgi:hypothetical protein
LGAGGLTGAEELAVLFLNLRRGRITSGSFSKMMISD